MFLFWSRQQRAAEPVNVIAPCTLPDEAEPFAPQMRMLSDLADSAMGIARAAAEQYAASVSKPADPASPPPRRQPCPGSLFIRVARVVLNCIAGQSRLAAGMPIERFTLPRNTVREAASPAPIAEQSGAEPVRQALRTVTRNHPYGAKLLSASLENLAGALAANPHRAADPPSLFQQICSQTGIRLNPSQERKAARELACQIRAAPA
jgi:hypothetical protein